MNKVKTCLTLFVLALLSRPAAAQLTVTQSVFGSGGIPLQDGTRRINGTVGQQAIGVVSDASALHLVGFWYVPPLPVGPGRELTHYALLATRSLRVEQNAQVLSGNIGVLDYGDPSSVELILGVKSSVADSVSAPRVEVEQMASVGGKIFYGEELVLGKKVTIGGQEQVGADFWPLARLPVFRSGMPGSGDVEVEQNGSEVLPAGAYGAVEVGTKGTLILEGGVYELTSLEVGEHAAVRCQGRTTLLIADWLTLDTKAWLGVEEGSGLAAGDLQVYVPDLRTRRQVVPGTIAIAHQLVHVQRSRVHSQLILLPGPSIPWPISIDFDSVAIGVGQVKRFAHSVIGRASQWVGFFGQAAHCPRKVSPAGQQDGKVVKARRMWRFGRRALLFDHGHQGCRIVTPQRRPTNLTLERLHSERIFVKPQRARQV